MAQETEVPKGFDVKVGRERGDGWITKKPGAILHGRLLGRYLGKQQDDDGNYQAVYQVKVITPCEAVFTDDAKVKHNVTLEKGQIVNVGEHKALEDLAPYCSDGGVYNVWAQYISEDPIPGTKRTFWKVKGPFLETLRPARHAPTQVAPVKAGPGTTEGDIPF